jgi:hypothetical protein
VSGEAREPGWYPDRNDPEFNRYWNGRAWTARRLPVGVTPPPPVEERALSEEKVSTERPPVEKSAPRRRIPIWMWIVGGLMVARSIIGVMAAFDGSDAGTTAVTTNPTPAGSVSAPQTPHS